MKQLTDEQVKRVAVCVACQEPVELDHARAVLDQGASPGGFYCKACREDPERMASAMFGLGRQLSTQIVAERIKAAGLERHFKSLANERKLRDDNRQN